MVQNLKNEKILFLNDLKKLLEKHNAYLDINYEGGFNDENISQLDIDVILPNSKIRFDLFNSCFDVINLKHINDKINDISEEI